MNKGVQLYGVYDGHGGGEVSAYIRDHLVNILRNNPFFAQNRMELALEKSYQQIDLEMATTEGMAKLLNYRPGASPEEK